MRDEFGIAFSRGLLFLSRVPKGFLIRNWLPAIAWMIFIFIGSTSVLSAQHTSRIIVPFLRWINPGISEDTIRTVQTTIRKTGHVSEYSVLALLILWARRRDRRPSGATVGWNWSDAILALVVAAAYAGTDEFHQSFVPGREASVWDVLIDTVGAGAGIFLLWFLSRWRKKE